MTHIFIVTEKTFKIHLQYMFAGTGNGEAIPDFIGCTKESKKADYDEKTFASMIADISKIRVGDRIAFYVTGCQKVFGFFKAKSSPFFNSKSGNFLGDELGRYLPFRVLIEPDEVFAKGITEHDALDCIENIVHPYEMCWSLIYRKLTGMRGCSFITDFESKRLYDQIATENGNRALQTDAQYDYDDKSKTIKVTSNRNTYSGATTTSLEIKPRLLEIKKSFETHLQAYISQNYDKDELCGLLFPNAELVNSWFGNEVVCSVGEQRIDCMLMCETKDCFYIRVIELKDEPPSADLVKIQLDWYLKWVRQYIVPQINKNVIIIPTIIAPQNKRDCNNKTNFIKAFNEFNNTKTQKAEDFTIENLEFISFDRVSDISFKKVF